MEPITEITTVVHAFKSSNNSNFKFAVLNVYQHPDKTHKVVNKVGKRIRKKIAKIQKNEGIRGIIIVGNFKDVTPIADLKAAGFRELDDNLNTLLSNFEPKGQGMSLDAEKWREVGQNRK